MASTKEFRLLRPAASGRPPLQFTPAQRQVIEHRAGVLRVFGGPGTGKTATLIEAVANRVTGRGIPVADVLMLTFSRAAAGELRDQVTARLHRTISQPVARTFHSYAYGLVRRAAAESGNPPPRLLSGSEQDVILRELLAGRLADDVDDWPGELAAAVRTRAFTDELRELLMRCVERDVSPQLLAQLGQQQHRPDWTVAADVLREYLQVTALQAPGAFDAAELIQRAVFDLRSHPDLLVAEQAMRRRIFVDEFADTDPAQLELLSLVSAAADELVLFGDPDQSIFGFRGSEQQVMNQVEQRFVRPNGPLAQLDTVVLDHDCRSSAAVVQSSQRVADRLPGTPPSRQRRVAPDAPLGNVRVAVFPSASHEAADLAATLRRAHLEDGVAWSQMAVLVRSAGPAADAIRRGLATGGVPVVQLVRGALVDEPLVVQLLTLLRCLVRPESVTESDAEALLIGSVGRADPLQLMRVRRQLRRLPDGPMSLVQLIVEPGAVSLLNPALRAPIERVRAVLEAGELSIARFGTAEDVLWAVWDATGLSARLERRSLAIGSDAVRADRDLDAVMALFGEAAKVTERAPGSGAEALDRWVSQLQITDSGVAERGQPGETVTLTTAHAAKGRQWRVVCVAGVQEGVWPNLRRRGSLLGAELLVDVLAGRPAAVSGMLAERLAEERRLFYVAVTRAQERLHVTAVDNDDEIPSQFLDELDPLPDQVDRRLLAPPTRPFALSGVVAELRTALIDPSSSTQEQTIAAELLAKLARDGVSGADPVQWWGLPELSTRAPLRPVETGPVPIRPSRFQAYSECELRALLTDLGGVDAQEGTAAALGTLVHWVAEQAPADITEQALTELLEQRWAELDFSAPWHAAVERGRAQRMMAALAEWLVSSRTELDEVAREQPFRVEIGDAVLSGTVDRLERDAGGRLVVIDLKTSKSKPSAREVADHPQLAAYQLAVREGAFTEGRPAEPGGAQLVQVGAASPGAQAQLPMADFDDPEWVRVELARIAAVLRGDVVTARPGPGCQRCPVRPSCPVQVEGQQVTS
ncbi:MAG: putative ATP-dependent helicase [Frankiales bacterium]|nr:putative ATP-dependent helicase [Frankiales bacterium]